MRPFRYEYAEGRRSGVELVGGLAAQLPTAVLDDNAQLFFLPLVLRVANDDDPACRKASLDAIRVLLRRCSAATFQDIYTFVEGWLGIKPPDTAATAAAATVASGGGGGSGSSDEDNDDADAAAPSSHVLAATAAQVSGVCVESRPDLVKRRALAVPNLVGALRRLAVGAMDREQRLLAREACATRRQKDREAAAATNLLMGTSFASVGGGGSDDDRSDGGSVGWSDDEGAGGEGGSEEDEDEGGLPPWTVLYQSLVALEKALRCLPSAVDAAFQAWDARPLARRKQAAAAAAAVAAAGGGADEDGDEEDENGDDEGGASNEDDGEAGGGAAAARGGGKRPRTGLRRGGPRVGGATFDHEAEVGWCVGAVSEALVFGHPWVRLAACRVLGLYLARRSPQRLSTLGTLGAGGGHGAEEYLASPGSLMRLCRRLLTQIDEPDGPTAGRRGEVLGPGLVEQSVKNLVFLAQALAHNPHLTPHRAIAPPAGAAGTAGGHGRGFSDAAAVDVESSCLLIGDKESGGDDEEEEEEGKEDAAAAGLFDPLDYLMKRTNMMSRRRGDDRRAAVFQFFGAFAATQPKATVKKHLRSMVDALHRAKVDGQSNITATGQQMQQEQQQPEAAAAGVGAAGGGDGGGGEGVFTVEALADEVLRLLEDKAGSAAFLKTLSQVQRRFLEKREKRRRGRAAEAIVDPEGAAERKLARNRQKKEGEKRRKRAFGEMRKAGGSRGKGKGKGKGMGQSANRGLSHGGGGFGRKRAKG